MRPLPLPSPGFGTVAERAGRTPGELLLIGILPEALPRAARPRLPPPSSKNLIVFADRRFLADDRVDGGEDRAELILAPHALADHHQVRRVRGRPHQRPGTALQHDARTIDGEDILGPEAGESFAFHRH